MAPSAQRAKKQTKLSYLTPNPSRLSALVPVYINFINSSTRTYHSLHQYIMFYRTCKTYYAIQLNTFLERNLESNLGMESLVVTQLELKFVCPFSLS